MSDAMNKAQDLALRISVFAMLRASDVLLADFHARLLKADNAIDADVLRTNIKLVREARVNIEMVA